VYLYNLWLLSTKSVNIIWRSKRSQETGPAAKRDQETRNLVIESFKWSNPGSGGFMNQKAQPITVLRSNDFTIIKQNLEIWKLENRNLRRGWVFLERAQILSGIQITKNLVVETKRFFRITVNVIFKLMRQICCQHSSMSAGSKRRALGNSVYERICHMFTSESAICLRANLPYVPDIKMLKRLTSRSVHFLVTCEKRTAAHDKF